MTEVPVISIIAPIFNEFDNIPDLYNRIKGGVAANAPQQPILGILDRTGGEIGGEFVLFNRNAGGTIDKALRRKQEQMDRLHSLSEKEEAAD